MPGAIGDSPSTELGVAGRARLYLRRRSLFGYDSPRRRRGDDSSALCVALSPPRDLVTGLRVRHGSLAGFADLATFSLWLCQRAFFVNDPSAGSPTETLLRLLLPLDAQV